MLLQIVLQCRSFLPSRGQVLKSACPCVHFGSRARSVWVMALECTVYIGVCFYKSLCSAKDCLPSRDQVLKSACPRVHFGSGAGSHWVMALECVVYIYEYVSTSCSAVPKLPAFERPSTKKCLPSSALWIRGPQPLGNGSRMRSIYTGVCFYKLSCSAEVACLQEAKY
jgi:hypothetical protein